MEWETIECCDCGNMVFVSSEKEQCKNCEERDILTEALTEIAEYDVDEEKFSYTLIKIARQALEKIKTL